MFFRYFSYVTFLLQSTNQHGVHSPFMYDFVTKGIYNKQLSLPTRFEDFDKKDHLTKKQEKILSKIIQYFKPIAILKNLDLEKTIVNKENNLLYFKHLNSDEIIKLSLNCCNSFIIIKNIHQSKSYHKNWKEITKLQEATVTVDLFHFGLIFFRKEQAKEHFRIRV